MNQARTKFTLDALGVRLAGEGPRDAQGRLVRGRECCLYNHNSDDVREVIADSPSYAGGRCTRVDSLGHFVLKFSDDHGCTWSSHRYDLPTREMQIDRQNPYGGRFIWEHPRRATIAYEDRNPVWLFGGVEADGPTGTVIRWSSDPGTLKTSAWHHVVATVDGGPKVISFVVDGALCDGGEARQFGWGRFGPDLRDPHGDNWLRIGPGL